MTKQRSRTRSCCASAGSWRSSNERFTSLGQLNRRIAQLVDAINDKAFKKLEGSRRTLYEAIDRPALTPLPPSPYVIGRWKQVTSNIDYHVDVERHYYSVPYQLVGKRLDVRTSASSIEVLFKGKRAASHMRSFKAGGFTTTPAHMPESHRRHAEWTPSRMIAWAEKTGPETAAFAKKLIELHPHPEHGYRSIREHGLDRQPLPTDTQQQPHRRQHKNVRGGGYYR